MKIALQCIGFSAISILSEQFERISEQNKSCIPTQNSTCTFASAVMKHTCEGVRSCTFQLEGDNGKRRCPDYDADTTFLVVEYQCKGIELQIDRQAAAEQGVTTEQPEQADLIAGLSIGIAFALLICLFGVLFSKRVYKRCKGEDDVNPDIFDIDVDDMDYPSPQQNDGRQSTSVDPTQPKPTAKGQEGKKKHHHHHHHRRGSKKK